MKWVKLMIAALTLHSAQALSPFVSPPRHVMHSSSQRTICSRVQRVMCSGPKQNDNNKLMANVYGTMFGLAIAQQLSLCAGVAAGRLGLWNPPPVNMFTDIADRAMEEAIQTGSINMYVGTPYAIHIWKDLLDMYYANGESVDFLTRAGGVCASHGTWCDGIVLPPSM